MKKDVNYGTKLCASRTFQLSGDIDDGTISILQESMVKAFKELENGKLVLLINSEGGSLSSALSFWSFVKFFDLKIVTVNLAVASSAALAVFLSGHYRFMSKYSHIIIHSVSAIDDSTGRNISQIKLDIDTFKSLEDRYHRIILKNSIGLEMKTLKEMMKRGMLINPKQALKLDWAHKIFD